MDINEIPDRNANSKEGKHTIGGDPVTILWLDSDGFDTGWYFQYYEDEPIGPYRTSFEAWAGG